MRCSVRDESTTEPQISESVQPNIVWYPQSASPFELRTNLITQLYQNVINLIIWNLLTVFPLVIRFFGEAQVFCIVFLGCFKWLCHRKPRPKRTRKFHHYRSVVRFMCYLRSKTDSLFPLSLTHTLFTLSPSQWTRSPIIAARATYPPWQNTKSHYFPIIFPHIFFSFSIFALCFALCSAHWHALQPTHEHLPFAMRPPQPSNTIRRSSCQPPNEKALRKIFSYLLADYKCLPFRECRCRKHIFMFCRSVW